MRNKMAFATPGSNVANKPKAQKAATGTQIIATIHFMAYSDVFLPMVRVVVAALIQGEQLQTAN